MIPGRKLFEAHLAVADLERATVVEARRVAFYWLGGRAASMLGLWETGSGPQRMRLH